jgi:TRAP-type mannitol/chloroaromatic compound transport system permease large subunit
MSNSTGLWMLLVLGLAVPLTGLPVWALLVGVSGAFALGGLLLGGLSPAILSALAPRLVGLLEHDLLQALPLYVFIGLLLQRVAVADAVLQAFDQLLRRSGRSPLASRALAGLGLGALIAPMSGSVAATASLLARLCLPRLSALPPDRAVAVVAASATVGVVVPPSLVLLLLGDAMLRAHTEASNLPGYAQVGQRIVNTQDVLHAALLPGLMVLLGWIAVTGWTTRSRTPGHGAADAPSRSRGAAEVGTTAPAPALARHTVLLALATITGIVVLLVGVFSGRLLAVEGAASAGCIVALGAVLSRRLSCADWRDLLLETLALSGALFALLVGATTFSLVFRLFGTDAWLSGLLIDSSLPPALLALGILALVGVCALVLDAFEMIFVIIPLVAPVLVLRLGDAQQVAVLLLLMLQLSFLLPPMGYAAVLVRSARLRAGDVVLPWSALARALLPYLAVPLAVILLVLAAPGWLHGFDEPNTLAAPVNAAPDADEVTRRMLEMAGSPQDATEAADPAGADRPAADAVPAPGASSHAERTDAERTDAERTDANQSSGRSSRAASISSGR